MQSLNQQLHVPVKDCREAAEFLLAVKLVCPLGGQYVVRDGTPPGSEGERAGPRRSWRSSSRRAASCPRPRRATWPRR